MVRINLLPHRQIRRAERQRQFNLMLVATVVAAGLLAFMIQTVIGSRISAQESRNARLSTAIAQLDKEIVEIKDLKQQISSVLERKEIVEKLQNDRSQAVILLDEIARQLPEGLYLRSIKQQGNQIELDGVADTNARVATLVRNLFSSKWMESPRLIEIKAVTVNNQRQNQFKLSVNMKAPGAAEAPASPEVKKP
ncbi:MAG TPA: PilN domain-containing protein [Methylophilaceae bacterium]|nr:PilN domain-containing protein [Methylophilaceae bacterium]